MDQQKLESTLNKLLQTNIAQQVEETHLNQLIEYLSRTQMDPEITDTGRINAPFFQTWLKCAVDQWKTQVSNVPSKIVRFAAEFTASMCTVETVFVKVNFTGLLEDFIKIFRSIPEQDPEEQLKVSYIKLMSSFLHHKSGVQWIMATNFWFDVFTMISQSCNDEISDCGRKFIVHILEESVEENNIFCCNVLEMVLAPLKDLSYSYLECSPSEYVGLKSLLNVINKILQYLLEISCKKLDFRILRICLREFNLETSLRNLIKTVKAPDINFELNKTLYLVLLFSASEYFLVQSENDLTEHSRIRELLLETIVDVACFLGTFYLELIYFAHGVFNNITSNMQHRTKAVGINDIFHNNMMLFLLRPLHDIITEVLSRNRFSKSDDEFRDLFYTKIIKEIHHCTFRAMNKFQKCPITFSLDDGILALRYLIPCSKFYSLPLANVATQKIMYIFVDVVDQMTVKPEILSSFSYDFFTALLGTIQHMLNNFDINWKDIMETIYLIDVTMRFLNLHSWPSQVLVAALQVLEVGISKSLSPNMALLVDSQDDTDIENVIFHKLADSNFEVRYTAIKLVKAITIKAKNKFESCIKLLLNADFPQLILKVATNDPETTVKVAAIQCLQEMVKVNSLWNSLLSTQQIYDQIQHLYYLQIDDLVRMETITLLKDVHKHQLPPEGILDKMYSTMSYAVLEERHRQIRINALEFWHEVIKRVLSNQGMIDGTFPSVTFSRSLKRIIFFDGERIRLCLSKALDELAEVGCLRVFIFALRQTVDDDLKTRAVELIGHFVDLLRTNLPEQSNLMVHRVMLFDSDNSMNVEETYSSNYMDEFCRRLLGLEATSDLAEQVSPISENRGTDKNEFMQVVHDFKDIQNMEKQQNKQLCQINHVLNDILELSNGYC